MKKYILAVLLCSIALCTDAQKISRNYQDLSLSKVLEDLNKAATDRTIYFIYDELEDFTVTTSFQNLTITDALRQVIGFYPMKVTYDKERIFEKGHPIEFANISLFSDAMKPKSTESLTVNNYGQGDAVTAGTFINGSVSNENGDFVIPCDAKRATIKVTCVGYKTVKRSISVGEIGTITLHPETYMERLRARYRSTRWCMAACPSRCNTLCSTTLAMPTNCYP